MKKEKTVNKETLGVAISMRNERKYLFERMNDIVEDGINDVKDFPYRWYVRNPKQNVIDYLNKKYNKKINIKKKIWKDCGFGEINDEYFFVPPDASYHFEITQKEFDLIMRLKREV